MAFAEAISGYALPLIILSILLFGMWKRQSVFDEFLGGAKEGLQSVVNILPTLVGLLVGIGIFRASGAMDFLIGILTYPASLVGMPPEVIPLGLLRPLSGGGSLALVSDIMSTHGPDSFIGNLASVMMGSTETTFYVIAVYFAATKVTQIRFALAAALLVDVACVLIAYAVTRWLFM